MSVKGIDDKISKKTKHKYQWKTKNEKLKVNESFIINYYNLQ